MKTLEDMTQGLAWTSRVALNRYLLMDMHNKYSDYASKNPKPYKPLPVWIADVYVPQEYVRSVQTWFRSAEAEEQVFSKLKVPVLHPMTVRACD